MIKIVRRRAFPFLVLPDFRLFAFSLSLELSIDIGTFQHLLEPVQFAGSFPNKVFAVADKFPLVFIRDINGL